MRGVNRVNRVFAVLCMCVLKVGAVPLARSDIYFYVRMAFISSFLPSFFPISFIPLAPFLSTLPSFRGGIAILP
jgi:hypothetical protein